MAKTKLENLSNSNVTDAGPLASLRPKMLKLKALKDYGAILCLGKTTISLCQLLVKTLKSLQAGI
jgi:hypothetical protein